MKVFVYSDGGSRGNPGIAGSGSLVIDAASKKRLAEIVYAFDEPTSNNVAEYRGLIEGLRAAAALGATEAYVFMDSKLVIEQMTGRWKIKHPAMQKLAMQARKLAEGFERVTYTWVPREQNKDADELSNIAMDASAAGAGEGIVEEKSVLPADKDAAATAAAPAPSRWCGAEDTPTTLVLVRHGETEMSAAGQYAGRRDLELTATGQSQAEAAAAYVAKHYDVDAVITSPLLRCVETAEKVAAAVGRDIEKNEGLIELDFGDYEGLTFAEADERDRDNHRRWLADPTIAAPGGESVASVHARVGQTLNEMVSARRGQTIVAVTHVNPIKSAVARSLGAGAEAFARIFLDLGSVSVIDILDDSATVPAQVRSVNIQPGR